MGQRVCCVCHARVREEAPRLGSRAYCENHYAKVGHDRKSAWRSSLAIIAVLVLFTVLGSVLLRLRVPQLDGIALVLAGVALSLVPAILWLVFFYLQDTVEPEPKGYVVAVFSLGALLAAAVGIPVVRNVFRVQDWLGASLPVYLAGSMLVVGVVQEFLKYVAVRYSVYPLPEFDERMDGILYGTAAGLGYATALSVSYIVSSSGVNLEIGFTRIVVTALAQASFSGITGYFLARAKFEDEPIWWLPLGLAIASVLNGLFTVLQGSALRSGSLLEWGTLGPWLGLAMATGLAVLTLVVLLHLIRRAGRIETGVGEQA